MTFRAVVIGLVGALFIAALGYINEAIFNLGGFSAGQLVPVIVFGPLIVAMLVVNLVFRRFKPGFGLKAKELALIFVICLTAVTVPGPGLTEPLMVLPAMPVQIYESKPGWQKHKLMDYAPARMFVCEGRFDPEVLGNYVSGSPGKTIRLNEIPWWAWRAPLKTWLPLFILVGLASIGLALVVHRQWSQHERLRYPIADFATSLIEPGPRGGPAAIFRNKLFWAGLIVALSIRTVNGLEAWYGNIPTIPLRFSFPQVAQKWPIIEKAHYGWDLFAPRFFPIVIAFTFFLSKDVSLSLGVSMSVYVAMSIVLVSYGIETKTDNLTGGGVGWMRAGSFIAFGLMLLYVGRRYYLQVAKEALFFRRAESADPHAVWGARAFILASAGAVAVLIRLGLDWPWAVLSIPLVLLSFLVVARIAAETGLFYVLPSWTPVGTLLGFFGAYSLGVDGILITAMLGAMLLQNPSNALLPYLVNGLKTCESVGLKAGRIGLTSAVVFLLCAAVAVPTAMWANYNWGNKSSEWLVKKVPEAIFNTADRSATQLSLAGELDESNAQTPLARLRNIRPEKNFLAFAGSGFLLVILFGFLRLRLTWWPLHPVLFLVWATHPMKRLWASLLLGWFIKVVVTSLGGYQTYRKCRGLMIGVIAGELLAAIGFMAVGALYRIITGMPPKAYQIFFQ